VVEEDLKITVVEEEEKEEEQENLTIFSTEVRAFMDGDTSRCVVLEFLTQTQAEEKKDSPPSSPNPQGKNCI